MRGRVGYVDALKILGIGHSKVLDSISRLLGGVVLVATAAVGQPGLLALLAVRDELVSQTKKLLTGLGQRTRGATGKDRTELLVAAHTVVGVNAYFEALRDVEMPVDVTRLQLTSDEELALAGSAREAGSRKLVETLLRLPLPLPTPYRPYEQNLLDMQVRYFEISQRLIEFISGLALWDQMDESRQSAFRKAVMKSVPSVAIKRYEEGFRQLSVDCPEFSTWMSLADSAASRASIMRIETELDIGFTGLRRLLESLQPERQTAEWPSRLSMAYLAQLDRPIAEISPSEAVAGLTVPTLGAGYVTPRFRVAQYDVDARPAEDGWWAGAMECLDIEWFLAGYLTSPTAVEVPLVVLGQPGSGKSSLTKVLAASLPPEEYLPVRVELRRVAADARVQDQIESALREATGEHMEWPQLVREAGDVLPVVMLDGFDELLQSTGVSHSDYLEQVRDFQRREADQGRRVAVIVTSRTVVASRVRFPASTAMVIIEPFDNSQIEQWLTAWNGANASYLAQSGLDPLPVDAVLTHRDLAEQPLLLLMLAFYDAVGNSLQHHQAKLGRADLYEGLLARFVDREIDKLHQGLDVDQRQLQVNGELHQLSVAAFAMFNRGKKSVAEQELDADLAQLLPEGSAAPDTAGRMALSLSRSQLAVARFFFIHKSQARVDETRLNTYEFLHATFGEYLVARLVRNTLIRLVNLSQADVPGLSLRSRSGVVDDDLWDLLSFTPLSDDSQTVAFLAELIGQLEENLAARLRGILQALFLASLRHRHQRYGEYEPRRMDIPVRHATYSVNLLILSVLAADGPLEATTLFATQDRAADAWRRFALLWRSQLDPASWDGLINTLEVMRAPDGKASDLLIRYERSRQTKPLEHFSTIDWLGTAQEDTRPMEHIQRTRITVERAARQAAFLYMPELDLLLHALQPLLQRNPSTFGNLVRGPDGHLNSVMHATVVALVASVESSADRGGSANLLRYVLSRWADLDIDHIRAKTPTGTGKFSWFDEALAIVSSTQVTHGTNTGSNFVLTPWLEITREEKGSSLGAIQLHLAQAADRDQMTQPFPGLGSLEESYASINPVELAESDADFIAQVYQLANESDLSEWASTQGLITLTLLPDNKLRKIRGEDFEFVISNSSSAHARSTLLSGIINRYNTEPEEGADASK